MAKYYTRNEVAEKLSVSIVTVGNYIKEVSDEDIKKYFNHRNQPNDEGVKLLEKIQRDKNPNIKFLDEIEEKEEEIASIRADYEEQINKLKKDYQIQIVELKSDKAKLVDENKTLQKEKEEIKDEMNDKFLDLYKDTNDKLTQLIHQSNTIAASLAIANKKIEELESKTIDTKYEEPEEKKSFFQRLFGK